MTISYLIVILLTVVAVVPGIKERDRLTYIEALILVLLMSAPWSLMRDVPQYMTNFEDFFSISSFPEILVRIMLAACFIGTLEVMSRTGFSMGSIIAYIFLALPTIACNQLRLSFGILVLLYLQSRLSNIKSILVSGLIHQSLILSLFLPKLNENFARYGLRLLFLFVFGGILVANYGMLGGIDILLPYLGNFEVYLNAKEISDIYDQTNLLQNFEFPFFFLFVSVQARSFWPAILVSIAFAISKALTDIPVVITMRFFELFCLLLIFYRLRDLDYRQFPVLMFGIILLARFYLHYSVMPEGN